MDLKSAKNILFNVFGYISAGWNLFFGELCTNLLGDMPLFFMFLTFIWLILSGPFQKLLFTPQLLL